MKFFKTKTGKWIQWTVMLSIAIILLYFAFKGVKWQDFMQGIADCNFHWILLSMLASILAFIIRGWRWRLTMLPLNPSITRKEAYDGVTVAYLTNFALPRLGEFARCGVIAGTGKTSFESALGSVVLERTWDLLSYFIILIIVLLAGESSFRQFVRNDVLKPAVEESGPSLGFIWIILLILAACTAAVILIYIFRKRLAGYRFFSKMFSILKGLYNGLVSGLKMKHKWRFFLYTILMWTCYWMMSWFTILAFPQISSLNWADALFLMVIGGMGWIIPVQGGIGAYHFILSLAMASIYGIPQTSGVVFATISHESQALTMLICGAISLSSLYLRKRSKEKNKDL